VFLNPSFLYDAGIAAIHKYLKQKLAYLCLHGFSGPFGRKWRFWGQNIGRGVATLTPNKLVLTFGSCYLYATFEEIDQEM